MGIIFHWFKGYEIKESQDYHGIIYFISLMDHHTTGHSAGNVIRIQKLFDSITEKVIPTIDIYTNYDYVKDAMEYLDSILINPEEMARMCDDVLRDFKIDEYNLRDRVERIKELSDDGYYVAYDVS